MALQPTRPFCFKDSIAERITFYLIEEIGTDSFVHECYFSRTAICLECDKKPRGTFTSYAGNRGKYPLLLALHIPALISRHHASSIIWHTFLPMDQRNGVYPGSLDFATLVKCLRRFKSLAKMMSRIRHNSIRTWTDSTQCFLDTESLINKIKNQLPRNFEKAFALRNLDINDISSRQVFILFIGYENQYQALYDDRSHFNEDNEVVPFSAQCNDLYNTLVFGGIYMITGTMLAFAAEEPDALLAERIRAMADLEIKPHISAIKALKKHGLFALYPGVIGRASTGVAKEMGRVIRGFHLQRPIDLYPRSEVFLEGFRGRLLEMIEDVRIQLSLVVDLELFIVHLLFYLGLE